MSFNSNIKGAGATKRNQKGAGININNGTVLKSSSFNNIASNNNSHYLIGNNKDQKGENNNFSQQNQLLLNNNQQQSGGHNQLQATNQQHNNINLKYNSNHQQQQQQATTSGVVSNTYSIHTINNNNNQVYSNNHSNELNNKTANTTHTGEMSYQAQLRNIQAPAAPFMPPQQPPHPQYQQANRVAQQQPPTYSMPPPNTATVVASNQQTQQGTGTQQSTTPQSNNPSQQQQSNTGASSNRTSQQAQPPTTSTSSTTSSSTQQQPALIQQQTGQQQTAQFNYDNQTQPPVYSQQQQQRGLISTAPQQSQQANVVVAASQQQGSAQPQPAHPYGYATYAYAGAPSHHIFYQDPNNIPIQFLGQPGPYGGPAPHQYNIYQANWNPQPQQQLLMGQLPPSQTQPQQSQPQQSTQQARYQNDQQQSHLPNQQQTHHQNAQHHITNQTQLHIMQQQSQQPPTQSGQQINPQTLHLHGQQAAVPPQPTQIYAVPSQFTPASQQMLQIPYMAMVNQNNAVVPPQISTQPAPYQKRERKPLLIVDPTTKQAVNPTADNKQDTNKENSLTKSSTQPSISSSVNSTTLSSTNLANRSTTSSNSISAISATPSSAIINNSSSNLPNKTIDAPNATTATNNTSNNNNSTTTTIKATEILNQTPIVAAISSVSTTSIENKKKNAEIQQDFALKVLKTKQENDKNEKQSATTVPVVTGLQQTTTAPTYSALVAAPPSNIISQTKSATSEPTTDNTVKTATVSVQKATESNKQPSAVPTKPSTTPITPQVESKTALPQAEPPATTTPTVPAVPQPLKPVSYSNIVASTVPKTAIATARQGPVTNTTTNTTKPNDSKPSAATRSSSDNNNNKPKQPDQMNNQQTASTDSVSKTNKEDLIQPTTINQSKPAQTTTQTAKTNNTKIQNSKSNADLSSKIVAPIETDNKNIKKSTLTEPVATTTTTTPTPTLTPIAAPTIINEEVKQTVNLTVNNTKQANNETQLIKDKKVKEPIVPPTIITTPIIAATTMPVVAVSEKIETQSQQPQPAQQQTTAAKPPAKTVTTSDPEPVLAVTTPQIADPIQPVEVKIETDLNCWTPENKDAKKRYDREFLLSLKDKKLSKAFPEALNNFELAVLDQMAQPKQQMMNPDYGRIQRNSFGGNINPDQGGGGYGKGSQHRQRQGGPSGPGNKKQSMDHQPPAVITIPDVPIRNRADKPYIPKKISSNQEMNDTEDLFREVRNILNKLTPQNIQKLTGNLINLPINSEDRLKGAIDIIFEKSIDEQVFSQTYAQLCKVLSSIKVPSNAEPSRHVNFRTMLLTRCQKEFDTDYYQEISYDKLIQEVDSCTDEQKKRELKELAEEKLAKAKRRSLGNIRFIGELFKLNMLTEGIMNDCIERLLKQESDEENIECLCRLLTTIGKEVDKQANAQKMKSYFERLDKITKKKEAVTARIRFMILDVIDLRKNQWVPRRKDNKPRPLEEIRKEAEEEQARIEAEIAKNQQNERRGQGMGGQKGGPAGQRGAGGSGYGQHSMLKSSSMDSEAFNSRGQKPTVNMVKKITDVKHITKTNNNSDLLLGPGGGSSGFGWNKAAAPKPSNPDSSTSITTSLTSSASFSVNTSSSNINFSKVGGDDCDRRTNLSSGGSISSSTSQGNSALNKLNKQHSTEMTPRLSMDSNRGLNYKDRQVQSVKKMDGSSYSNLVRSETSSQTSSRETSLSRPSLDSRDNSRTRNSDINIEETTTNEKCRKYTSDEVDRKVTSTLDEYIQNKDLSEALKDCEEFKPVDSSQYVEFIELYIQKVLERSDPTRNSVGVLFYNIIKENKIDIIHFTNAFKSILEMAEDMAIDVPKIANYLSQIIAPLFQKDFSVSFLSDFCEPIKSRPICAELISEILHNASNRLGHSTVNEIFKKSNLNIHDFLKGVDNPIEFIKNNNLQWVLANRERTQSASVSSESYEKKLFQILQPAKAENEAIFDKIEAEFGELDCQSKHFIRALVTAVYRCCSDTNNKIDPILFKIRSPILTKFINRNEEFELEALFAIQALDHKMQHQPAFIRVLFDMFYDEDIISEGVFWIWKREAREEGHAISALSLKSFFDWLSEPDPN